ncbi:MAG: 2'-5' RNA ligase family protein [bacterium]|nr:2'-5' RNA ligase family protein [bacterium]
MNPEELIQKNVLVFPAKVHQRAMKLSALLASLGTEFTLDTRQAIPHISLYQAAYPSHSEDLLLHKVRQIAATTPPFEVELRGFSVFWETFVFWDAVKNTQLSSLHQRLLGALNPVRDGMLLPIHEQLLADETIPAGLRESIRKYGNPLCGDEERPHLTLARLKDAAQADAALQLLRSQARASLRVIVSNLFIGTVGPHGTCPMLGRAFALGG